MVPPIVSALREAAADESRRFFVRPFIPQELLALPKDRGPHGADYIRKTAATAAKYGVGLAIVADRMHFDIPKAFFGDEFPTFEAAHVAACRVVVKHRLTVHVLQRVEGDAAEFVTVKTLRPKTDMGAALDVIAAKEGALCE